jgi:Mn2+/Fe2+ NRAMP family transporter
MIDLLTFAKNFNGLTIPDALIGLLEFQNKVESMGSYSSGFKLTIDEEKYGLRTYSED